MNYTHIQNSWHPLRGINIFDTSLPGYHLWVGDFKLCHKDRVMRCMVGNGAWTIFYLPEQNLEEVALLSNGTLLSHQHELKRIFPTLRSHLCRLVEDYHHVPIPRIAFQQHSQVPGSNSLDFNNWLCLWHETQTLRICCFLCTSLHRNLLWAFSTF